jgi:hypothetical protein
MYFKRAFSLVTVLLILPMFALACAPTPTPTPAPTYPPTPASGGWTTYNADNRLGGNIVAGKLLRCLGPGGLTYGDVK